MGLSADNQVEVLPGFAGTAADELAMDYVLQKPSYWKKVDWATSATVDTNLHTHKVNPLTYATTEQTNDGILYYNCQANTPMSYYANWFRFWRGDIVIRAKFIKTKYHSGRLSFWFCPGNPTALPTRSDRQYLYQQVVDIRETDDFAVTIPFTSLFPYKRTVDWSSSSTEAVTGTFGFTVINPLLAASTVSSTISILLFVSAAPGFEFAAPSTPQAIAGASNQFPLQLLAAAVTMAAERDDEEGSDGPVDLSESVSSLLRDKEFMKEIQTLKTKKKSTEKYFSQASGDCDDPGSTPRMSGGALDNSGRSTISLAPARSCIGEVITSLRQLLKRSTLVYSLDAASNTQFAANFSGVYTDFIFPGNIKKQVDYINLFVDWYSIIGVCYAFRRGGYRLKWMPNVNTLQNWRIQMDNSEISPEIAAFTPWENYGFDVSNQVWQAKALQGGIEVEIPQYNNRHAYPVRNALAYKYYASTTNSQFADQNRLIVSTTDVTALGRFDVARQGSEDTNFGFFIGVPYTYSRAPA
jgi:hypothetical protein